MRQLKTSPRTTDLNLAALSLALVVFAGCKSSDPSTCSGFVGDRAKAPEAQLFVSDGESRMLSPVSPGTTVPLEPPPQGGYVIYATTRLRNVDICNVSFRGQLKDPTDGTVVAFDGRSANLVPSTDGWGMPDPSDNSNLTNVNPCPAYGKKDIHGGTWLLEVTATDRDGRTATASVRVVPTCNQSSPGVQQNCVCTCSANYTLGKCNFDVDGGDRD